ncbi:hypothetical protein FRC06_001459 [Ceratobasidium sp. 370]|nr:hypothetical protein FRC06_001459 [Ceratobasidium sp. 370]
MEVADSHMLEQPSTFTPSSHIDIDMSGDYYDEEYMMHDAHPTTELVDDEEIYDAEIEDQAGHTEVEMDEYRDELIDDNEANMGTYLPADDATVTDVTVEDVHLPSSPVGENAKIGHDLHEVIDLTEAHDENSLPADDSTVDPATHEDLQADFELAQTELYEDEGTPTVTNSPVLHASAVDQLQEEGGHFDPPALSGVSDSLATSLSDSEPVEQHDDRASDESHSPIEDALVLNQQVRDDAADTMEPSPPVRLSYDDKAGGTTQIFDIFSPIDSSPKSIDVLFADNRTLFYDPLSVFFTKLRETNHFSDDDWQDAEMELSVDLNGHRLSITEDHKQTDQVSLFRLYFIWSGLGLADPLRLTLQRHPERFSVRYAQLVDHLEQRDIQGDGVEELHEVVRHEMQGGAVDSAPNRGEGGNYLLATARYRPLTVRAAEGGDHTVDVQQVPAETHDVDNAHDSERDSEPHDGHVAEEDARPGLDVIEHSGVTNGQRNEDDGEDGDGFPHNSKPDEENTHVGQAVIDALGRINTPQAPASPVGETGQDGPVDGSELNGDLYNDDEYADEYTDEGNTSGDAPEQRGELVPLPDKEYDEYEEVEEASYLAPEAENEGSEGHGGDSEHYYDEYDDVDVEGKFIQTADNEQPSSESPHQVPTDPQNIGLPLETSPPPHSPARHPLKRNLDDLENDGQEVAGSPTPLPIFPTCPPAGAGLPDTNLSNQVNMISNPNNKAECPPHVREDQSDDDTNRDQALTDSGTDLDDSSSDSDGDILLQPLKPVRPLVNRAGPTNDDVATPRGRTTHNTAVGAPPAPGDAGPAVEPVPAESTRIRHLNYPVVAAGDARRGGHVPHLFPDGLPAGPPGAPNAP